jgi:hypothetical protein
LLFLGLASAWVVVTIVPFMIGLSGDRVMLTGTLALASLAITLVPSWAWSSESKGLADDTWKGDGYAEAPSEMTPVAKGLFLTVILTLGLFAALIVHTLLLTASPDAGALMLARYVGGCFVSPVALTLFTQGESIRRMNCSVLTCLMRRPQPLPSPAAPSVISSRA